MRRYVVTGAPGAGMTTLLEALRLRGFAVVREAATDVITAGQAAGVDEPWTAATLFDDILCLQQQRQAQAPDARWCVDRSPIRSLALTRYAGQPAPPRLVEEVDRFVSEGSYERRVLLVRPLGFIVASAARRISCTDALAFEEIHESTYRELGFDVVGSPGTPSGTGWRRRVNARWGPKNRRHGRRARGLSTAPAAPGE